MIKAALAGAHGVGKTTAAKQLAARLEAEFPSLAIAVLPEVARQCPWPINQEARPEAQQWIFHSQMTAELEAGRTADILICDRSGLDSLIYAAAAQEAGRPGDWSFITPTLGYFMEVWLATYACWWWLRPSFPLAADGLRDTCPAFQAQVDGCFASFISGVHQPDTFLNWPGLEEALMALRRLIFRRRLENALAGAAGAEGLEARHRGREF